MTTKSAVRRIPPPRTLSLDSLAELQAFRQSVTRRWKPLRLRVTLRLPWLRSARNEEFERRMNRWIGRNGGFSALWTAGALTGLAVYFPLPPASAESLEGFSAWIAQVALGWVLGWLAGMGGMRLMARWQLTRLCRQAEAEAAKR